MTICRFLTIFLILAVFPMIPAQAKTPSAPPVYPSELKQIAKANPETEAIYTHLTINADLKYNPTQNGFQGRIIIEQQIWLRTKESVARYGRVVVSNSKIRQLKSVHVEIKSLGGQQRKSYNKNDLEWVDHSRASRGIVQLDTQQQHAAVPSLRVGDLLYFRQVHDVKGLHGLPVLTLGDAETPILNNTYSLTLPENHHLEFSLLSEKNNEARIKHTTIVSNKNHTSTWQLLWSASNPEAEIRITPQVINVDGEQPSGSFVVGETWESVGLNYRKLIDDRLKPDQNITTLATGLVASCQTDSQRITVLYDYLQKNTRYLGLYEGMDGIIPETAISVHKRCYGDCKGLATYFIALLTVAGIKAEPVLVRTAGEGLLDESLPNMNQFNHVIVWADVGPGGMWLDATVDHCPAGMIVPQDAASKVLLLGMENAGLKSIPAANWLPGILEYSVNGVLDSSAVLACTFSLQSTGIAAVRQRHLSEGGANDLAFAMERILLPRSIGARLDEFESRETDAGPRWICKISSMSPLPRTSESIFMPMVLPPLPKFKDIEDPAEETDRQEEWSLLLPEGWVVTDDDQVLDAGTVVWHRKIWQEDNRMHLVRTIRWHPENTEKTELEKALKEITRRESGFITINIRNSGE